MSFKQDRLENEKNDPQEASSLKFINVPIVLIALFVGFGVTYLAMRTDNTDMNPGDSRTAASESKDVATPEASAGSGADLNAMMEKGKQTYTAICQACHQANGMGLSGAFPPLAGSEWVNGPAKQVAAILLFGIQGEITVKGEKFQSVMPPLRDQLKPEEIAAVATFVRNSFGNQSPMLTVDTVNAVAKEYSSRTDMWNGETELKSKNWE